MCSSCVSWLFGTIYSLLFSSPYPSTSYRTTSTAVPVQGPAPVLLPGGSCALIRLATTPGPAAQESLQYYDLEDRHRPQIVYIAASRSTESHHKRPHNEWNSSQFYKFSSAFRCNYFIFCRPISFASCENFRSICYS